jgi:biotin transport system ATP-binding protein
MIRLRGAGVRFGERWAVRGVDLELPERKVVVLGANGSGKSTLARLLNGLVLPTEGSVQVDGLDPVRSGHELRRRVGFVFTDPDAQIVMPTVAEDVAFSLRRRRLPREEVDARVREVLARFGLADHHDHPAHLLSGGQKQLLALAAVLVTEPQVLVCDEPTTLLDLRNTRAVGELLLGLEQQVVLVTHDLDLVPGWDRVVVVDGGRVVADGDPASTVARYRELTR